MFNGLLHLKQQKITHRDIKPKNLILFNNGKVIKIADFGVSQTHAISSVFTLSQKTVTDLYGSKPYLPPNYIKFVDDES